MAEPDADTVDLLQPSHEVKVQVHPLELVTNEVDQSAPILALGEGSSSAALSKDSAEAVPAQDDSSSKAGDGSKKDGSSRPVPSASQLKGEVAAFIRAKKDANARSNQLEFLQADDAAPSSARTGAVHISRAGQIKVTRAHYEDQETPLAKVQEVARRAKKAKTKHALPHGVEERVSNLEHFLGVRAPTVPPVNIDVYKRLKVLEDRVLELETRYGVTRRDTAPQDMTAELDSLNELGATTASKGVRSVAEDSSAIPVVLAAKHIPRGAQEGEEAMTKEALDSRIAELQASLRRKHGDAVPEFEKK